MRVGVGFSSFHIFSITTSIVIQNFVIPESQNPESRSLQIPGAHCVRFNAISMLPTIDFDNEQLLKTYEVKNGRIKRVLATKLDSQLIAA